MKHIIKVASLQNLPDTRPLIAWDGTNLFAEGQAAGPQIELVDLGLSSGTLWAKCNFGAETETDTGLYFAWGELSQKEGWLDDKNTNPYDWSHYRFGTRQSLSKYNTTDNLTELLPEDDIVTVTYGNNYKIPSLTQANELINGTYYEFTTINNIDGYKFISKVDSDKYIFLPCAGTCANNNIDMSGHRYWTSTRDSYQGNAQRLALESDGPNTWGYDRCYGMLIRPVYLEGGHQNESGKEPALEPFDPLAGDIKK